MIGIAACSPRNPFSRRSIPLSITGIALFAIGSATLALGQLPLPLSASMMGCGGAFFLAASLRQTPQGMVKIIPFKEGDTYLGGCALGTRLKGLDKAITGIKTTDGIDWQASPEEMILRVDVKGFPEITHLPLCLFRHNDGRPKNNGETVEFSFQGKRYTCVLDQEHPFPKTYTSLVYQSTPALPRSMGNEDAMQFLEGALVTQTFPDPRQLKMVIQGGLSVRLEPTRFLPQGEYSRLRHGHGYDWHRPDAILVPVDMHCSSPLTELPLCFFLKDRDFLEPKKAGDKVTFFYNDKKYRLTLTQGEISSLYFQIPKPPGSLPDPRDQELFHRLYQKGRHNLVEPDLHDKMPHNVIGHSAMCPEVKVEGNVHTGEIPYKSGQSHLIRGINNKAALLAFSDPKETPAKWRSLSIEAKKFPRKWLYVFDVPTPKAKLDLTWEGNTFILKVGSARGSLRVASAHF